MEINKRKIHAVRREQRKTLCVCNLFVNSRLDENMVGAENPEGLNGNDKAKERGPKNGYEKKNETTHAHSHIRQTQKHARHMRTHAYEYIHSLSQTDMRQCRCRCQVKV